MNRKRTLLLTGLALAGLLLYYLLSGENDHDAINRRLDELATILTVTNDGAGTSRLFSAAGRANNAASYSTEDASIQLGTRIPSSRKQTELKQILAQVIHAVDKSTVSFDDRIISIDVSGTSAVVTMVSHAVGWMHNQEHPVINAYTLQWVKQDGEWLISNAEITKT